MWFYTREGKNYEGIENICLFIPLPFSFLASDIQDSAPKVFFILYITKLAFLFSVAIEFCQFFDRFGTFQISDLFQNTLGGFIGGLIYWLYYHIDIDEGLFNER